MDKKIMNIPALNIYFLAFFIFSIYVAKYDIVFSAISMICVIILFFMYFRKQRIRSKEIVSYLNQMNFTINTASKSSVANFPISTMIIYRDTGEILWCNDAFFKNVIPDENITTNNINNLIENFNIKDNTPVQINEKYFNIYINDTDMLSSLFFVECTDYIKYKNLYDKAKTVVAIIVIDNYEELLKNQAEAERSNILADINKKISEWIEPYNGMLRKYDRDRFIFVFNEHLLGEMIASKFPILSAVKTIVSNDGITATLSIGMGLDASTLNEKNSFASLALDMALSRGGDQVVIKSEYNFEFFGGASKEIEKRTKVKSRVMASALNKLIRDSSNVIIMGHKHADIDSLGASVGMAAAVREKNKPVYILINRETTLAGDIIEKLSLLDIYKDIFIDEDSAIMKIDINTLLIIVDTNAKDYVESNAVLESVNKIAVIDHHRRGANYIDNAAINMHEPYASSTCELVSELMQYMLSNQKILKTEAEAILAGIYLDTKGFTIKAGARTFEAAAYLKRAGADMTEVKKMFQNTFDTYMIKQRIISKAIMYKDNIAISICDFTPDRAVAASACDELLNITEIKAAFVIFSNNSGVSISGRSLGDINVQVILEKIGGGGNQASAGAQFETDDIDDICNRLYGAIDEYNLEKE